VLKSANIVVLISNLSMPGRKSVTVSLPKNGPKWRVSGQEAPPVRCHLRSAFASPCGPGAGRERYLDPAVRLELMRSPLPSPFTSEIFSFPMRPPIDLRSPLKSAICSVP
jgi:hypothetical protein